MRQQSVSRWTAALDRHLRRLLTGGDRGLDAGAELEVRGHDGQVVFLAPLARHHRIDQTGTLWVRPVVGGSLPGQRSPAQLPGAFDPDVARRRGLAISAARRDGDELVVDLHSGEQARIRPARPTLLAELQRWDTWVAVVLTAEQEAELDALDHDPP